MNQTIRIVLFEDGGHFVAQALEVDVAAQGRTVEEARARLHVALCAEADEMALEGRNLLDLGPAPAPFHALYDNRAVCRETIRAA